MEGQKRANLKRKRPEAAKEDLGTRISGKLHHELHEVYHACKKAKAFETQKLVKRLKQLRATGNDPTAVEDHEAQLNSIKAIDHNLLGNSAFRSKILKDKLLRENQFVQDSLTKEIQANILESPAAGTPLAKIQSRLLSSKIIASQVSTSLGALKSIIDPDVPPAKRSKSSEPSAILPKPPKTLPADQDDESSGSDSAEAQINDDHGWESGTVDGDEDNLEESEAEEAPEDGWESGSIHGSDEEATEDDDDDDRSEDGKEELSVKAKIKKEKANSKPTAVASGGVSSARGKMESTFLPSLAVGFIPGSDDSDVEGEGSIAEPRKNRRGQRARRAIWEKKYGRNANHKKKEMAENEKKARIEAWSRAKKSQTRPTDRGPQRKTGHGEGSKAPEPSKVKKDNKDKDKPLHPSWEAKRKLKEKQSDAIVPSQGKKIKF